MRKNIYLTELWQLWIDRKVGCFFLYDYGGTGKTFMCKTLTSTLRSQRQIVLTVASSETSSLLVPGGWTAHSKFKILVSTFEDSICNIHQGSELVELLKVTKLIIWDEAPMGHKFCFEALDKSLRDIMGLGNESSTIFGGKIIVFGGDFRQMLPFIPRGSWFDIVHSMINASYIWDHCEALILKKNMCLQSGIDNLFASELNSFSQWILDIGDGKISKPNDGCYNRDPERAFHLRF